MFCRKSYPFFQKASLSLHSTAHIRFHIQPLLFHISNIYFSILNIYTFHPQYLLSHFTHLLSSPISTFSSIHNSIDMQISDYEGLFLRPKADFCEKLPDTLLSHRSLSADSYNWHEQAHFGNTMHSPQNIISCRKTKHLVILDKNTAVVLVFPLQNMDLPQSWNKTAKMTMILHGKLPYSWTPFSWEKSYSSVAISSEALPYITVAPSSTHSFFAVIL